MYCRNCGQKIEAGDKFCSSCGEKTILANESDMTETAGAVKNEAPQAKEAEKTEEPLFEPFKFDALDFEKGLAIDPTPSVPAEEVKKDIKKPTPPTEEFDWGIHTFPGSNAGKTADTDFNWSAHPDEIDLDEPKPVEVKEEPAEATLQEEPEVFMPQESKWQAADMPEATEQATIPEVKDEEIPDMSGDDASPASPLEESLFKELDNKADEARKQSEEIDKFFTFNKKNEEFQKLLDQEYEKIKSGNILKEEMDTAAVASEEKFASIKPEDPMEDLFVSSGVVKGYEPKPVETDVLDRIEAAEAEKKAREDAARLIEEEKAKAKAEAEEKAKAEAEALATAQAEEEAARLRLEEEAKRVADARAAQEAAEREQARAAARAEAESAMKAAEEKARKAREEAELKLAQQAAMEKEAAERAKAEAEAKAKAEAAAAVEAARQAEAAKAAEEARIAAEKEAADPFNHISEMARARQTYFGQQDPEVPTVEDIREAEAAAESTKAVDKAAILAGMATASKIVQRDKQASVEAEPVEPIEAIQVSEPEPEIIDLPDFLGHLDEEEATEPEVQTIDKLDDFLTAEEAPKTAEELDEIPADLFSVEDLIADEVVPQQTETSTETLVMNEESVADILNNQSEADEAIVFPEDFNTAEDINETINQNNIQEPSPFTVFDDEEDDDDEEEGKGGKGRIVLKICLVILIILLAMEITGVVIKIAAPNSGAAKFIDTQLNKVIHVFTGDENQYSVFAANEDIRSTPMKDKTSLIKEQMGKNKDGNIEEIKYNANLKFDPEKKYKNTDLMLTQDLSDVSWYKDAENKQVYYDEAIVGAMIAYNSQKVNLINNNDTSVLNLMQKGTDLYKEVKKLGDKGNTESFKTLEIGEIRQAGSSFYVWVSEKVKDSKNGTATTKKIYELQPEDQTMKVVASYDI